MFYKRPQTWGSCESKLTWEHSWLWGGTSPWSTVSCLLAGRSCGDGRGARRPSLDVAVVGRQILMELRLKFAR